MNLSFAIAPIGICALAATLVPSADQATAPPLSDQQRQQIVGRFATAITHDDHQGIIAVTTPDMTWTIPGDSVVSGRSVGRGAVLKLADTFANYSLTISVRELTFGADTVAVELHDTGRHNGKTLDEDIVNVLTISRDGKVSAVDANLGDVKQFDSYFS
ncbi:nuclear transport factor 2 family protein [Amycolatopsis sp. NPDC050768]|uniref:nuclear transport factor 2 family protein n=1 Tax=Amycolatopsis sp. NPDC050768 TaxID=3154839 RepID=UPI0033F36ED5